MEEVREKLVINGLKFTAAIALAPVPLLLSNAQAAPPPPPVMEPHLKLTEIDGKAKETRDIFRRARLLAPGIFVPKEMIKGAGFDGRKSGSATVELNVFENGKASCTQLDPANAPRQQRIFSKEICLLLSRNGEFLPALGRNGKRLEGKITLRADFHRIIRGRPVPGHCPPECGLPLSPYPGEYAELKKRKQTKADWLPPDQYTRRFATVYLWVSKKGKPKNCHVQRSSGSDIGDYRLCKFALKKMKFKAARMPPPPAPAKAKKIAGQARVTFEMPWPRPEL